MDIEIIGILKGGSRPTFILDREPNFLFEKEGALLTAKDGPLRKFYNYMAPSPDHKAFGGDTIYIPMVDGSFTKGVGQWWDYNPMGYEQVRCISESQLRNNEHGTLIYAVRQEWSQMVDLFIHEAFNQQTLQT